MNHASLDLGQDLADGGDQVLGSVSDGNWTSLFLGHRNVFKAAMHPAAQAGQRALRLQPDAEVPQTAATGTARIATSGAVKRLRGTLALERRRQIVRTLLRSRGGNALSPIPARPGLATPTREQTARRLTPLRTSPPPRPAPRQE